MTASCRRPLKRSTTPRRPTFRSSWPSTRSTSRELRSIASSRRLSDQGLLAEDWGGDVVTVPVSAKQKTNLDLLLEMILLVADMKDLKANPKRLASGVVLEAKVDKGRGCVATVLVQNGTLELGDSFVAGSVHGRVRALINDRGANIADRRPFNPGRDTGACRICRRPAILSRFLRMPPKARQVAEYRQAKEREQSLRKTSRLSLQALYEQMREGTVKELPLILKGDVQGSVEVLTDMLNKLSTEKAKVKILHSGAGAITETDVLLASASNAIIIGFNVRPERKAQELADSEGVEIRLYTVIYNVTNDIKSRDDRHAGIHDPREICRPGGSPRHLQSAQIRIHRRILCPGRRDPAQCRSTTAPGQCRDSRGQDQFAAPLQG